MEQEKKKGKKKGLVILLILLLLLAIVSVTVVLVKPENLNIFQQKTEIENLSDAEQTLRERLAAEGTETIEITEDIEIYGGPLIVNGNKKLVGEGAIIAVEGFENGALLYVSDGAKLQVEEVKLNANLMAAYVVYVAKSGEATIGDGVNIGDAAESNVYNEGTLTMTGGRLRKGEVGITNKGTAVIEDGIVALMNRYLVDNLAEGTLEIKGGSFSSSEGYGIYNRGTMTVASAEVSANKLMGICNLGKADVKDSVVSMNSYHNIINKSRATLSIENTEIVGSSQSGIHNEENAYAVVTSCKFNTNTLGNVHNRGEIEIYKCSFEDVAYSSVISDGKVATTYIEDTTIGNTTSTGHGILSTNGCQVELKDVAFVNVAGRAIHNKGGFVTGKNITVDGTGKVAIGNNAYETGSYGSIKLKNVDVTTPFVAIINDCDGTMEIKDGKLISTQNTTVRISSGTMTLEDVAVTGAKAQGETKFYGVYANGGTLNIKDCSIKDTSSRGIQNYGTIMNIDGLTIENTGAAAMGTLAVKEGVQPSTITANNLTITNAGTNSICNAGATSKIVVTNSVINPAGGNSIKANGGVMTMENTKIYGSQKDECVAVLVDKDGTLYLKKGVYITNEKGRGVTNSGILSMEDTTVENCKTTSHGGAIYNAGQLTVKDSVLYKNVAGANGGAIHATAVSTMELSNVEMNDNTATGQGGAINLPGGTEENKGELIKITDVTIKNNTTATKSSGAIYVGKYRQLEINGKNTEISRNSAKTTGGAIGAGDYASVTMNAGTISGNEANHKDGGGAVFLWNATFVMNGGTISKNIAEVGDGGAIVGAGTSSTITVTGGKIRNNEAKGGSGGAIHAVADTVVSLSNVELSDNTANVQGGAINLKGGSKPTSGKLTLTDVTMKDNEASTKSSGAIYVGKYRQLEINGDDTLISGNSAKATGGAIGSGDYASITMNAGTISGNEANAADGGGAVFLWNATFVMDGGTISKNIAKTGDGGAVVGAGTSSTITVTGGTISNNEAKGGSGGAIHAVDATTVTLSNVELSGNTANTQGGAINLKAGSEKVSGKLTLTDVTMKDNKTSTKSSGAIFVGEYRQLEISGDKTVISGNSAKTTGGAIGTASKAKVIMNAGTISGNEANASDGGGAIFLWQAAFEMNGGTISGNKATNGTGGAIAANDGGVASGITINAGTISGNTANKTGGGGIYLNGKTALNMTGGTIKKNTTQGDGGAIYAVATATIDLSNVELSGNTAKYQGGAINLVNGTATGNFNTLTNVTIKDNTATTNSSGAVYVGQYRQLEINEKDGSKTEISGNTAGTYAGAVGIAGNASVTLNAGTISGNTANGGNGGGAIYLAGNAGFTMHGGTISENTAKGILGGGAIFASNSVTGITITDGTISGNKTTGKTSAGAVTDGGAIYIYGNAPLTMTGGAIKNNTTQGAGGAIYAVAASTISLENVELSGNTAGTYGGAIHLANGSAEAVTLTNVTIKGNTATKAGGAVYVGKSRKLEINGDKTEISGNTTAATGGAIGTNTGAEVTLNAGTISGNIAKAGDGGGAAFLWQATFNMNGGSISGNTAENGHGGAIGGGGSSVITIKAGTISGNVAKVTGGGGIYLDGTTALTMTGGNISGNTVSSGLNGENVYIKSGTTVKLAENANLNSVYFAAGNAPIQVTGNTLNNPVTVTCTSANQAGILVVKKAEGSTADLKQLCENGKIIVGAGFDDTDYALIETDQGMAWTEVTKVTTFAELKSAIENTSNALQYIKVSTSLSVNETISVQNNANIILIGNATLTRASGFTDEFFNVASGSTLTLEGTTAENKLILDGGKENNITAGKPLIYNSGTLNINEGVVLQNNKNNATNGGAIYTDTTINLENVTLSGNEASATAKGYGYGGAIFLVKGSTSAPGTVTLTNVIIQGNTSYRAGGAVYVAQYRQLEIYGDDTVISGNSTSATGGAIGTNTGAKVTMYAGSISGNTASSGDGGGAVFLWEAVFDMQGGTISGNTATNGAGGAVSGNDGTVASSITMSAGTISGNTANKTGGGGIYLKGKGTLTMTGGTICDNVVKSGLTGENVYIANGKTVKLAGSANLQSVYFASVSTPIQVTAPLTAENVRTVITLPSYEKDTTVVSYTGTETQDMTELSSKFSLANAAYKLSASGTNLNVSAE